MPSLAYLGREAGRSELRLIQKVKAEGSSTSTHCDTRFHCIPAPSAYVEQCGLDVGDPIMLVKKPALFLSACNSLHSLPTQPATSSTSPRIGGKRSAQHQNQTRREYATITGDSGAPPEHHHEEHKWPNPARGRTYPTPYQIFDLKRNGVYSKTKYYELVKIYHPDRGTNQAGLTQAVKIERYHMIVAAHHILSDPAKRTAYDRFGIGWDSNARPGEAQAWQKAHQPGPFSHSWNTQSDTIWQNATWEDWERWRHSRDPTQPRAQAPVYFKNAYFIALVGLLSIVGSSLNYNRAQDAGQYFLEQRDIVHDRAARELRKVKQDVTSRGRDERIEWFLRNREATMGALSPREIENMREERAARVLADREACRSEEVKESGD